MIAAETVKGGCSIYQPSPHQFQIHRARSFWNWVMWSCRVACLKLPVNPAGSHNVGSKKKHWMMSPSKRRLHWLNIIMTPACSIRYAITPMGNTERLINLGFHVLHVLILTAIQLHIITFAISWVSGYFPLDTFINLVVRTGGNEIWQKTGQLQNHLIHVRWRGNILWTIQSHLSSRLPYRQATMKYLFDYMLDTVR